MKRLIVALFLSLSLGLAAHQDARADYLFTYPYGNEVQVLALTGGRLAFILFDWAGYWDIFTTHSYSYAAPAYASLGGGPSALAYFLEYLYSSSGYLYFDGYGTNNGYSWFYVGRYYL